MFELPCNIGTPDFVSEKTNTLVLYPIKQHNPVSYEFMDIPLQQNMLGETNVDVTVCSH